MFRESIEIKGIDDWSLKSLKVAPTIAQGAVEGTAATVDITKDSSMAKKMNDEALALNSKKETSGIILIAPALSIRLSELAYQPMIKHEDFASQVMKNLK
ncbi:hypothetical protein SARC_08606 [Sphaeroforma arctica JP610]|uniref:Uncharacterized protein n=1 Tax=Sphaeroforma arctica JP610 TaxID=667725 RepID=A0A0L0FR19_9EUKA|nr:hypothetical protein SARC_08606 [Sphaeroforma arctica JP610]KNC78991.1 hypothetical protein SARC_08606 [Sphaeroforma arctica JP610]|eukprot:XP_014152893.1 hypothetical protein SARC_08606 [Sphaeroforma arctica JP610]